MPEAKDPKTYLIEALRTFSDLTPGRDSMTEKTVEAWHQIDTVTTADSMYQVLEAWFEHAPEHLKSSGRYRVVDPSMGMFYAWSVKPSWQFVEDKHPKVESLLAAVDSVA